MISALLGIHWDLGGSLGLPWDLLGGVSGLSWSSLGAPLLPPGVLLGLLRPPWGACWLPREPQKASGDHFWSVWAWISNVL